MPTIKSILSIASTALATQQRAIEVTAHNIANASTEGYSRQRVVMSGGPAIRTAGGIFGSGVRVADVARVRDALLDQAVRRETAFSSEHEARSDILGRVETILGEPQEFGLSAAMDAFFSAWSELAATPASRTARTLVLAEGRQVAGTLNRLAASLDDLRAESEARLLGVTLRINELTTGIADVNTRIVAAEAGQFTAGDLRDHRARLVDELASLVPVTVNERATGSLGIQINGTSVVDGADHGTGDLAGAHAYDGSQLFLAEILRLAGAAKEKTDLFRGGLRIACFFFASHGPLGFRRPAQK